MQEKVQKEKAEQKKHNEDYFSFFSSHENIILKPESNFKGLRSFLTHLPIDYYILLQEGYDKDRVEERVPTNYIYVENIPLLNKIKSTENKKEKVQTVLMKDLYKCATKFEANQILKDPYALEEMIKHLTKLYGEIEEDFYIDYDLDFIL